MRKKTKEQEHEKAEWTKKGRRVRIADVLLNILAALVIVSFLANMLFLIHMVYNDSQHGAFSYDKERGCNSGNISQPCL